MHGETVKFPLCIYLFTLLNAKVTGGMTNWKGDGTKQSLPSQELSPHLPSGTKKNH